MTIYIQRAGNYVLTACATSCDMELSAEVINITTADSGRANEKIGGATDCKGSFDGVITIDQLGGWQYQEWRANIGNVVPLRFDMTDEYGDRLRYEMSVLITNISAQGGVNEFGSFSVDFERSGEETQSTIFDNILVDMDGDPILTDDGDLIRVL